MTAALDIKARLVVEGRKQHPRTAPARFPVPSVARPSRRKDGKPGTAPSVPGAISDNDNASSLSTPMELPL